MSTDYMMYDFKDDKTTDRFVLKVSDGKIDELLLVNNERATPDECLEFRLVNGAIKEEFIGKEVDEFVSAQLRERGENCDFRKYRATERTFRDCKIGANMLTVRGESTGLRYLKNCNETLRHETMHRKNSYERCVLLGGIPR